MPAILLAALLPALAVSAAALMWPTVAPAEVAGPELAAWALLVTVGALVGSLARRRRRPPEA